MQISRRVLRAQGPGTSAASFLNSGTQGGWRSCLGGLLANQDNSEQGGAYHATTKAALAGLRSGSIRSASYRNGYDCTARIEHLNLAPESATRRSVGEQEGRPHRRLNCCCVGFSPSSTLRRRTIPTGGRVTRPKNENPTLFPKAGSREPFVTCRGGWTGKGSTCETRRRHRGSCGPTRGAPALYSLGLGGGDMFREPSRSDRITVPIWTLGSAK
jgi:hypothetical protein